MSGNNTTTSGEKKTSSPTCQQASITREFSTDSETDFVVSEELLDGNFDDETTIAEAEAEGIAEDAEEIDKLKKESEMPIEELMRMYGVPPPSTKPALSTSNIQSSRLRKRNHVGTLVQTTDTPVDSKDETAGESSSNTSSVVLTNADTASSGQHKSTSLTTGAGPPMATIASGLQPSISVTGTPGINADLVADEDDEEDEDDEDYDEDDFSEDEEEGSGDEEDGEDGAESNSVLGYSAGSRLWCRALAPGSGLSSSMAYNSDDDEDYDPKHDASMAWKGVIRIGEQYQVEVPLETSLSSGCSDSDSPPCSEGRLLWESDRLPEEEVVSYIRRYSTAVNIPPPKTRTPDDEEALFWLMQSDYHIDESLRRLKNKSVVPSDIPTYLNTWSEHECAAFERGFAVYNKNFYRIRDSKLKSKTVGEIVQFYYVWKKTARHDEFMKMYRKDKKKFHVHPGITDYMDCLALEQAEIEGNYDCWPSNNTSANTGVGGGTNPTSGGGGAWQSATADEWARQAVRSSVRIATGSWCPGRTSLGQAEVDKLIEEAQAGQEAQPCPPGLFQIMQAVGGEEKAPAAHSEVQNGITSNGSV